MKKHYHEHQRQCDLRSSPTAVPQQGRARIIPETHQDDVKLPLKKQMQIHQNCENGCKTKEKSNKKFKTKSRILINTQGIFLCKGFKTKNLSKACVDSRCTTTNFRGQGSSPQKSLTKNCLMRIH